MSNLIQLIKHPNNIVEVRLNRPDKRNAMSFALLRELLKVGEELHEQRSVRAVILTGEGSSFSAGIDLADLQSPLNIVTAMWELSRPGPNLFQRVFLVWRDLPVPVIASIHGHCFGAGMQLALGADFRISHVANEPTVKALALANEICARSPDAVLAAKRVLNAMVSQPESDTLALEKRWQRRLLLGKNFKIAGKKAKSPDLAFNDREFD